MPRFLALGLLAAAVVLPACSSSSKSSSTAGGGASGASGTAVTIKSFSFKPSPLTVKAGATVQVSNADGTAHTVTADDKTSFDTSRIEGGASKTFTAPTKAGTYAYHCNIHDYMKGSLVVS